MTVKFYANRDSAVAVLRKHGIDRAVYNDFIVVDDKDPDITLYGVDMDKMPKAEAPKAEAPAEDTSVKEMVEAAKKRNAANTERLANSPFNGLVKGEQKEIIKKVNGKAAKAKPAAKKAAKPAKKATPKAKGSSVRNGISDWIRGLIEAGKTNKEIVEAAPKAGFDLTGKKAYFPAWYRFDMKRKAAKAAAEKATAKASKTSKA